MFKKFSTLAHNIRNPKCIDWSLSGIAAPSTATCTANSCVNGNPTKPPYAWPTPSNSLINFMAQNTHPDNCNCVEVHSWYGEGHASACPCHPENHNATHPLQEAVIMLGGAAFESASKAFSRAVQRLGVSS